MGTPHREPLLPVNTANLANLPTRRSTCAVNPIHGVSDQVLLPVIAGKPV
jgi:hypothetical protein